MNFGVSLAPTEYVLMMSADDRLAPNCAEVVQAHIEKAQYTLRTYYGLVLEYMDTGEQQNLACGAAVVSKTLWKNTGGFVPESAIGAPDAAFLSSIWKSTEFRIEMIGDGVPLYFYRRHGESETSSRGEWWNLIEPSRDIITRTFSKPKWGRYAP